MSKPRDLKSKIRDFKPRDPKCRFIKSTSKIPSDLYGNKNKPPTNPAQRYVCSESQRGKSSTSKIIESQSIIQEVET